MKDGQNKSMANVYNNEKKTHQNISVRREGPDAEVGWQGIQTETWQLCTSRPEAAGS